MSDAYQQFLKGLREHGCVVTENGDGKATAQCPAHDDNQASLSVGPRRDGKGVLVYCHAGCQTPDIVAALGLAMSDLFDDPKLRAAYNGQATYTYPGGRKVHRETGKRFWQTGNKEDDSLFGSERITEDVNPIYVCEGEKDVQAAQSVDAVAVCNAMGAGKAHKADWSPLAGHEVVIVADKDQPNDAGRWPGREHAVQVASMLEPIAMVLDAVEAKFGKDLADHVAADLDLDELVPVEWWPADGPTLSYRETTATPQQSSSSEVPTLALVRHILDEVADEVRARGLVGEERLAKTLYLVFTSRLLDKLVSAGVKGHSASGKSYTVETVTRFFPPEAYLEFTAMSAHALVYLPEEFAHRTLVVYEVTALREGVEDDMTSYFVRSLLSEGRTWTVAVLRLFLGKRMGSSRRQSPRRGATLPHLGRLTRQTTITTAQRV